MKNILSAAVSLVLFAINSSHAEDDPRILVQMPEMMQQHMLANMRDHLNTLNEILIDMANDKLDVASDIAEHRLGMSSLELHGASHLAQFMPEAMQQAGTNMHHAASRFAMKLQEGDMPSALNALSEVTSACVACHASYRIR
jgi:Mg/Co/Ni transporter MgtE